MISRLSAVLLLPFWAILITSCASDPDGPVLAGNTQAAVAQGESIYQQARQADDAGKTRRAIKLYDRTATHYPYAPSAAQARYRQAQLLEQRGKTLDAFDAYDLYLLRFPAAPHYSSVLARQAETAQQAARGELRGNFLWVKAKVSKEKSLEMLGKVRDRAPKSREAAKAQYAIAELQRSSHKSKEAIAAFHQLVKDQPTAQEAPEALFQVGNILLEEAERGNQNQGNLDLAREAFQDYLLQYPGHSKNQEARTRLASLSGHDLQRSLNIAEFYLKTGKTEAAKVYFRDIVSRSNSGSIHAAAKARLHELGDS